jgi:hypothetical protein
MDELTTLLESDGWVVECQSPLELRHEETESFASGWAAQLIFDHYRDYGTKLWKDE